MQKRTTAMLFCALSTLSARSNAQSVPPPTASPSPTTPPQSPIDSELSTDPPEDTEEEYGATAEVKPPSREPTRRVLTRREVARVPGVSGDPVRAIEVLPGVGRAQLGSDPLLRGAAAGESQVFFDGAPVPILFHFGGFKSFVSPSLVDRVEVIPSNFSVRYGRRTGGIVDVRARELRHDGIHGLVDLSLLDSSALVEGPVLPDTAMAVAARRSNIDFFFAAIAPEDTVRVVAAPVYWDYQAMVEHRLSDDTRLEVRGFGSRDSIKMVVAEGASDDPSLRGEVGGAIEFHRARIGVASQIAHESSLDAYVSVGTTRASFVMGPTANQHFSTLDIDSRAEWKASLSEAIRATAGVDVSLQRLTGLYIGDQPPQSEGGHYGDAFGAERLVRIEDTFWINAPAVYTELSIEPVRGFEIMPGVRGDFFDQLEAWSVDPRLGARAAVTETTTLKSGVGRFTQPPNYWEALGVIGNPALDPYHALHVSAGVEQDVFDMLSLDVEGFYKWIDGRPIAVEGGAPPRFTNDGQGRVIGAELGAQFRPVEGTFAMLAYTISRSERRDGNAPWRVCDCDQTHVLSLAAGHDLGRNWNIGARYRLVTGNPQTPIVGAVYDATRDLYRPLYGATNSDRAPLFNQLDARVEKIWRFSAWSLSAYLEVQNATNAQNQEGLSYSYDFSQSEPVTGLPIFPNFGVRGEL